jgi:hypothetical protein
MGNAHAQHRRLAPALIVLAVLTLVVVAFAGIAAQNAQALPTFNTAGAGLGPCDSCHSMGSIHAGATHSAQSCAKCHTAGTGTPPLPSACASCHTKAGILAKATHTSIGCGTAGGCHVSSTPTPTPTPTPTATAVATTVTAKAAPTTIRLGKTVKTTGAVTPVATLAGKKVALRVDFKKGTKWVKAKTASATVTATGTYSWKYKPLKKGTFRVKASIATTATYKASKTAYKTFKVK